MNQTLLSIVLALTLLAVACAPATIEQQPATDATADEAQLCGVCCSDASATEPRCETVRCACAPADDAPQEVSSCAAIQCPVGNDCVDGVGCVPAGEPSAKAPGTACTLEYNPVCGENGITYGNPCMANAEGMDYVMGECPSIE